MKLRDIIIVLAIAISIFLVTRLVIQNYVVEGGSMDPNLADKQWILVYKLASPERGDIIVFNAPQYDPSVLIKRVVGLPGETVKIEDGKVYIDDKLLTESYITEPTTHDGSWSVPADHYFVMGDNRNNSSDSRKATIGTIPQSNIIGRAWLRIYPFSVWGFAPNYRPEMAE